MVKPNETTPQTTLSVSSSLEIPGVVTSHAGSDLSRILERYDISLFFRDFRDDPSVTLCPQAYKDQLKNSVEVCNLGY